MSLYASGLTLETPPSTSPARVPGPAAGAPLGGSGPKDSRIRWIQDVITTPATIGPAGGLETTVGAPVGGIVGGLSPGDPAKAAPPPADRSDAARKAAEEAGENQKKEAADKAAAEKAAREALDKENAAAKKEAEEKKKKEEEEAAKKKYVDPDAAATATVTFPSPREIEAKLNQRKRPMNPNGGIGAGGQIDTSSPPPRLGGIDPTVAYFDGEPLVGIRSGGPLPARATPRYVPGHGPFAPDASEMGGGGPSPDTAWPWLSE